MNKALVVASAEFNAAVRTKAFLISVMLMPLLIGGSIAAQKLVDKHGDKSDKKFAVIDRTGKLYKPFDEKIKKYDAAIGGNGAKFFPEEVKATDDDIDEVRLALSKRVRDKELFAFLEIPKDAIVDDGKGHILYYSDKPTYDDLRIFADMTLNKLSREARATQVPGLTEEMLAAIEREIETEKLGLVTKAANGTIQPAKEVDAVRTQGIPIILMMLLFMTIMTTAPQLLNSVLEEKMSRISEVLLGSVSPFELMLGKLIGSAGICLVLAGLYIGGGVVAAAKTGYLAAFPVELMPWFALFLLLAVFFFGSLYIAVGSACSSLKDAQAMMTPVMLITVFPMFVWTAVLKAPDSPMAIGFSLFPPATPFLMLLRQSLLPPPPLWQVAAGVVLTTIATIGCVFAAAKIFRTGILAQGKPASFREMVRWVLAK